MKLDEQKANEIARLCKEVTQYISEIEKEKGNLSNKKELLYEQIEILNESFREVNSPSSSDEAVWIGKVATNIDEVQQSYRDFQLFNDRQGIFQQKLILPNKIKGITKETLLARFNGSSTKKTITDAIVNLNTTVIPFFEIPNTQRTPDITFLRDNELEKLTTIRLSNKITKYHICNILDISADGNGDLKKKIIDNPFVLLYYSQEENHIQPYNEVNAKWITNIPYDNNFKKIVNFCFLLSYQSYKVSDFLIKLANKLIINFPYFKSQSENERNIGIRIIQNFWIKNNFSTKELYKIMSRWFDIEPSTIEQICYNTNKYPKL